MIWSDPWIEVATTPSIYRPLCTRLPPPPCRLPEDVSFRVYTIQDRFDTEKGDQTRLLAAWNTLVQSSWTPAQLQIRLHQARIACIFHKRSLLATCVLRPRSHEGIPFCILETLIVSPKHRNKGYGAMLMRSVLTWLWDTYGPCILGYIWELSLKEFVWAWWRGRLTSAVEIRYGWIWKNPRPCTNTSMDASVPLRFHTKEGDRYVVISDSGLNDGWGYVQDCSGEIDWPAIAYRGGWKGLWSSTKTKEWKWSGEIVVIGLLNYCGKTIPSFRSAEITPRQRTDAADSDEGGYGTHSGPERAAASTHPYPLPPPYTSEGYSEPHTA
jgi:GNAT superfamily N-acetyltransferase